MQVGVYLNGLEICLCKAYDLSRIEDFRLVKKREILLPLNINLTMKKSAFLDRDLKSFIDKTKIGAKLSKNSIKISFRDV
jgi:hypothetical protein